MLCDFSTQYITCTHQGDGLSYDDHKLQEGGRDVNHSKHGPLVSKLTKIRNQTPLSAQISVINLD